MRTKRLPREFTQTIYTGIESNLVLFVIGILNPNKIKRLSNGKKVDEHLGYFDFVNVGILNIEKELNRKRIKTAIRKSFRIQKKKSIIRSDNHTYEVFIRPDISHKVYRAAYDLYVRGCKEYKGGTNIDLERKDPMINQCLESEKARLIAPYQILTCISWVESHNLENKKLREYLRKILENIYELK